MPLQVPTETAALQGLFYWPGKARSLLDHHGKAAMSQPVKQRAPDILLAQDGAPRHYSSDDKFVGRIRTTPARPCGRGTAKPKGTAVNRKRRFAPFFLSPLIRMTHVTQGRSIFLIGVLVL